MPAGIVTKGAGLDRIALRYGDIMVFSIIDYRPFPKFVAKNNPK